MTETFVIAVLLLIVGAGLGWMTAAIKHRSISDALRSKLAESSAKLDARNADVTRLERRVEDLGAADVKCAVLTAQLATERQRAMSATGELIPTGDCPPA